jgi:Tfp pilus assembly protein, pilus retraction ATPase PilT
MLVSDVSCSFGVNATMALSIDDLLRRAVESKASDLHLKVGNHPYLRVGGVLLPLSDVPRVTPEEMLSMAFSMMTNRQKQKFKETAELDMAYGVAGLGRFRVNVFQQRGNVGMVLRVIPTKIRTAEELNLPSVVGRICEEQRGLVLVTGTTGSGKSTTLAAMIDRINANRSDHLITIEDPIEFLHRDKRSFINQREVEVDTANFSTALRAALRQDPDVILVGEMRDLETISTPCWPRKPATSYFQRCTPWMQPKRFSASSRSSLRLSRSRFACSWLPL